MSVEVQDLSQIVSLVEFAETSLIFKMQQSVLIMYNEYLSMKTFYVIIKLIYIHAGQGLPTPNVRPKRCRRS